MKTTARTPLPALLTAGLFAILTFPAFPPSARACLNDRESDRSEKEFKSRYEKHGDSKLLPGAISPTPDAPPPSTSSEIRSARSWNIPGLVTLAAGIGLMGGAIFLVSKKMAR